MTYEDLIARLRRNGERIDHGINQLCEDAADRIEALIAERAKVAKAVDALEMLIKDCEAVYPPSHGAIKYFARAALAEIKKEKNDE